MGWNRKFKIETLKITRYAAFSLKITRYTFSNNNTHNYRTAKFNITFMTRINDTAFRIATGTYTWITTITTTIKSINDF
jgi:hypothetical protein